MINIRNIDDNECFEWSIVRYLNPGDHHPAYFTKADKEFARKFDFKDKISRKIQRHSQNQKRKKKSIGINAFGYDNKEKHPIFV